MFFTHVGSVTDGGGRKKRELGCSEPHPTTCWREGFFRILPGHVSCTQHSTTLSPVRALRSQISEPGSEKCKRARMRSREMLTSSRIVVTEVSFRGPWYMLWNVRSKTAKFWHLCTDDFPAFPSALDRTYHFKSISVRNTHRTCTCRRSGSGR